MVLAATVSVGAWLVVYGSAGASDDVHSGEPEAQPVIEASIKATGIPVGHPPEWHAARTALGRYELEFPQRVRLEVRAWDQTAAVVVRPLTERRWLVEFIDGHHAVDSQFSFSAEPLP